MAELMAQPLSYILTSGEMNWKEREDVQNLFLFAHPNSEEVWMQSMWKVNRCPPPWIEKMHDQNQTNPKISTKDVRILFSKPPWYSLFLRIAEKDLWARLHEILTKLLSVRGKMVIRDFNVQSVRNTMVPERKLNAYLVGNTKVAEILYT